jgi:PAS domain S-box-containing protein
VLLLVLLGVVAAAIHNSRQSVASSDWVNHTHAVILETDAVLSSLRAGEAALSNFLITGDPHDQAAYRAAFSEMDEHLQVAKKLTADNPRQTKRLETLEPLLARRLQDHKALMKARQDQGLDAIRQMLSAAPLDDTPQAIRKAVAQLKEEENILLQQRDRDSRENARQTRWILFAGVGFNFVLLGFIFWFIRHDLQQRRQAAAALQRANEMLEIKVQERTAQLAKTNESLALENIERQWAQAAVERLYRHNEQIINCIGEGVYVVSRGGNIIRINPAGARLVAWESSGLIGQPLRIILPRLQPDGTSSPWETDPICLSMKKGRELQGAETVLRRKDGASFPVRYSSYPVRDQDKVVGAVITIVDLSRLHSASG